jgi:hypothetical protein
MNIITHTAVGIALSQFFPPEYLPVSIVFSLLPDVEQVLNERGWRPSVGDAGSPQSPMHGLLGAAVYGAIGLLVTVIDHQMGTLFLVCVATHLYLDFVSGASVPFRYIKRNAARINFGNPPDNPVGRKLWIRVLQEASVITVSLLISMG